MVLIKLREEKSAMSPNRNRMQRVRTQALLTTALISLLATPTLALQDSITPISVSDGDATAAPADTAPAGSGAGAGGGQADEDVYPVAFFDQYTPQNALDMIRRLPGFSFDQGSDVRGFGGAAGNVLIDGARPTSKSGGLRGALERIPAAQVLRIEILRGGVSSGEAAGQSVVANVIRKVGGSSGTWQGTIRRQPITGKLVPQIEGTLTTKLGAWDTSFNINTGMNYQYREAEITELDAVGGLVDVNDEDYFEQRHWFVVTAEGSRPLAGGKLTLNARADRFHADDNFERLGYIGRPQGASNDTMWSLKENTDNLELEFGLTWNRTYANGWRWNVIGLANLNDRDFDYQNIDQNFIEDTSTVSDFIQLKDRSEYIGRTTYGKTVGRLKPEFGIEVARNKLDNHVEDYDDGVFNPGGSEDVSVTEMRGEAFASVVYQASSKLTLEGGMTFEASRINVTGDANEKQNLKFLKPRISGTYAFNDDVQLTLEAERRVGQLNLNDFGSSQQAANDTQNAGNPNLQPDKTARISATLDWKFSDRGSLRVEAFHEWRSDILEQIILPSGENGKGNAGDARFWVINTDLNLPLDGVIKGGLLQIRHKYRRSSFDDPVLGGATRKISNYTPDWVNIEFRQDVVEHRFAWGAEYFGSFHDDEFIVSESIRFQGNKRLEFFVETTRFMGVKMKLTARHANTGSFTRTRTFFDGDRGGVFTGSEASIRKRYPEFKFEISGVF